MSKFITPLIIFAGVLLNHWFGSQDPTLNFFVGFVWGVLVTGISAKAALTRKDDEYRQFFSDVVDRIDGSR